MQALRRRAAALLATLAAPVALASTAAAQQPHPWQIGLQAPHSPVKAAIASLNDIVTIIIVLICIFVGALLAWALFRYNAKRNPVPSKVSHNTIIEVCWTVIPVLILVVIAIPSFRLIYFEDRTNDPDLTIKVTAHQWFWEYTYPDKGNIDFSSYIIPEDKLKPGQLRMLEVDNPLVLPVGKNIRILQTSGDVIHSFFIPSLGVQRYAIPGRTIETWVKIDKPGIYYGECNQICGTNHSQMPIKVQAVTEKEFEAWLQTAKTKFAQDGGAPADGQPTQLADRR